MTTPGATTAEARLAGLIDRIAVVDRASGEAARRRYGRLATPPGALGTLETVGIRLAALGGVCPPPVPTRPAVVVAAGDHGVHAQGVTPWPQGVTTAMVTAICAGKASVNTVATTVGAEVAVLDVGVRGDLAHLDNEPRLRRHRIRSATRDSTTGTAMSRPEACEALLAGADLAAELVDEGADLLVPGDMGIANTTAAACLVAALTGEPPQAVTGPGAGSDEGMVAHKTEVVRAALHRHGLGSGGPDPLAVLAAVGGFEHAALTGVTLAAAAKGVPVVLDGVSTVAAALAAELLCPDAQGCLVAGHRSPEPAARVGLARLGLEPLVDAGLCVGEGTGGLLAAPIVAAAARILGDVATLDEL